MSVDAKLDRAIRRVVQQQNCSGCGACAWLDPGLQMVVTDEGFSRPQRQSHGGCRPDALNIFNNVCPGRRVVSPKAAGATVHPSMGAAHSVWVAWAADDDIRRRGSSGGVLTALAAWLTENGEASEIIGAAADSREPSSTRTAHIVDRRSALAASGSRYAPVSILGDRDALRAGTALIGKPCEISAARQLLDATQSVENRPLLLSFYCAGTPSQRATDALLAELGVGPADQLTAMWYRGSGWPGDFTAIASDGREFRTDYETSWGQHLGPAVQWRCKICPDGIGESSDIVAADYWHTDSRGYPDFSDGSGRSAVITRTTRGHETLARAFEAGVLIGHPLELDSLAAVQPLQVERRMTLVGRLIGAALAGRRVPRYVGFRLTRRGPRELRRCVSVGRGTYRRVQRERRK